MEAPSEPIETKPPPQRGTLGVPGPLRPWLSGLEVVELAGGREALTVEGGDLGPPRALVQERLELVEAFGVALGLDPDRAVGEVLGVACQAEPAGLALHRPAEAHPLDLPLDHGLQPLSLTHRGTTPAVPRTPPPLMPGW